GGAIVRYVRDKDDLVYDNTIPYPEITSGVDYDLLRFLDAADEEFFDSERDLYSFNFLNNSGKFVFTYDNVPIMSPYRKIEVIRLLNQGELTFIMVDENGIKYWFGAGEKSRSIPVGQDCGKEYEIVRETAWYLTRLEHPQGDVVEFEYE